MDADKKPAETPNVGSSWRGAFRRSRKPVDAKPSQVGQRESWRRSPAARTERNRLNWLMFRRIGLTAAALSLLVALLWVLFSIKHRVPLIVGFATTYAPPMSPIMLSQEDRDLLKRLSVSGRVFRPASVSWQDASEQIQSGNATEIVAALAAAAGRARPGGPGNDMIFVYLAMTGTLDRDGRPCLIPPAVVDVPVADESLNYIRVDRLLGELRSAVKPGTGIVLVLDSSRASLNWPLGVSDGGFAPAVESLLTDSKPVRTWVLLSAGAGQLAHTNPADGQTVFARFFAMGFRGAADNAPHGNGNGRIELWEMAAYLAEEVDRWSLAHCGERQTPLLVPGISGGRAADDPQVAWVVSRTPADQLNISLKAVSVTASALNNRSSADVDEADWWLRERWRMAEKLRLIGTHERPYLWENYRQHLMLAEQLRWAGAAFSDELIRVETLVERFELRLETFQVTNTSRLPSLRLRRLNRMQQTDSGADPAMTAWQEALIKYVMEPPPPGTPAPLVEPVPVSSGTWLDTTTVAWDWLIAQVGAGVVIDRDMLARWVERVGEKPANVPVEPLQVHVARMMLRWLDPAVWRAAPSLPGQLLRLVSLSRDAAYPLDVRADRVVEAFTPRLEYDKKIRLAIDLLFVGDTASLERAGSLVAECSEAFKAIQAVADETSRSIRFCDLVHDELPWLAAWYVREMRSIADAGADREGPGNAFVQSFAWTPLLDALHRFDDGLFERLSISAAREKASTPSELVAGLAENRKAIEQYYKPLRAAFDVSCEDLASLAADTPATLAGIQRLLETPLAMGNVRMQLIERADRLQRRFALAETPVADPRRRALPKPVAATAVAGWIPWRETLIHPLLPILRREFQGTATTPSQSREVAVAVGRQVAEVREMARSLPKELAQLQELEFKADSSGQAGLSEVLEYMRRGEFLARSLAAVTSHRNMFNETTPTQKSLMSAWHDRLVNVADTMLDDFWAGLEAEDPIWSFEASRIMLQKAVDLTRDAKINHGELTRRKVEERLLNLEAAADAFGKVSFTPKSVLLFPPQIRDDAPANRTRLTVDRDVPSGVASMWLAESMHDRPLPVLRGSGAASVPRLPVLVGATADPTETIWRLDGSSERLLGPQGGLTRADSNVLDMVMWYRGHRIVTGMPLETAATIRTTEWRAAEAVSPRVTVRGDLPRNQSVSIVFDCSGSMGERLPDGRTRLEAGRESLYELLETISRDGGWSGSLWLYGHRTKWSRDSRGRYSAGLTEAGKRERDKTVADGKPFRLVPGDDVEQVMEMQPLSPVQVLRMRSILDAQEPGGETPLYRAINEALRVDCGAANPGPAHVLAVTDGANDQSGGTIVTSSDVLRTLSRVNFKRSRQNEVRVDVIGFNMMAGRFDREMRLQELQSLAGDSGGRYFDATDPGKLAVSLRNSLRISRWGVEGGLAARDLVKLDEPISLPRPVGGRTDTYDVKLDAGPSSPRRRIAVSGNEGLELFLAGGGRSLEFRRYDGGTEQGLRDSVTNLPDPSDPSRRCFIGAHMAVRDGTDVTLPVSIQNSDPSGFSPRPVEAWVEVQPKSARGAIGLPYVFYDLSWQPFRPAPVLNLTAPNWPLAATTAEIRCWFRFRTAEPEVAVPLQDLVPGVERRFDIKCLPGSTVRAIVSASENTPRYLRLSVIEEHPQPTANNLPLLKVAVSPGCLRAVHILEPGTGRVRHEFEVAIVDGQLSGDVRLLVTDRQAIIKNAVGSLTATGAAEPLIVPIPAN
jgi:hypothetical protein